MKHKTWNLGDVLNFAAEAHKGQTRKYSGDPYIMHPVRVAFMASEYGLGRTHIAAALLHDVIEDCDVSLDEITVRFGRFAANIVWGLTNYEARYGGPDDTMNRADRKAADRVWLAAQAPGVKSLKILDCIDNILDQPSDGSFMDVMLSEMELLVDAMVAAPIFGDHGISFSLIDYFWRVWNKAATDRADKLEKRHR